jgi:hypothetical protein
VRIIGGNANTIEGIYLDPNWPLTATNIVNDIPQAVVLPKAGNSAVPYYYSDSSGKAHYDDQTKSFFGRPIHLANAAPLYSLNSAGTAVPLIYRGGDDFTRLGSNTDAGVLFRDTGQPITSHWSVTRVLAIAALGAYGSFTFTMDALNAVVGDAVAVGVTLEVTGVWDFLWVGWVSAPGEVSIRIFNTRNETSPATAAATWRAEYWRH